MEDNDSFQEYIEWFREELISDGRNLSEVEKLVNEEIGWREIKAQMAHSKCKEEREYA